MSSQTSPTYSSSMFSSLQRVIIKHPKDAFINQTNLSDNWQKFNYIEVPNFQDSIIEFNEFLTILEKHVPNIDYLPHSDQVGMDSIYTHDPVKFTKYGAIILRSGKELRQPEAEIYKEYLELNGIPIVGELTGDALADGGDLVWLDDRTLAVGLGYRTNLEAIKQLSEITKDFVDELIVVQLPHDQGENECLHLMSFISMIDTDLAVVHSRLMPVFFRQLLIKRGITLIEVPNDEYLNLGCNVLALAPRVCVMITGNEVTKKQLIDAGATVYEYKGNEISYKGTGGPTCLTCPVVRN
ncbi:dimethylarginine dimethylaminohydrolase family protein [Ureibacillus aquaedulcis]|uniref:Arginine deiminase family protein n=1 Tax=Ureibacillus aquaedulcis TaxID=3058421 RepID=A0ABT8GM54_9BACL|nr:arginine deiminase family protein [Ureibacillus sp. BA0131]MDN4492498.1 arginine deiminase family protein [Ureibacillus sp. BA0131]